ncbi:unnamed protein product, partial [Tilletia laevis]
LVHEETESLADSERDEPRRNATKRSDVGPQTPAEGDETVTRFYRFISSTLKTKTRRKTGEVYKGTDERWQCRFCNGYYTGHPENRSNLALHLNVASNKNCCKKIYDPEDKSLRGLYKQPTKEDAAAPGQHSPAGTASSTSTSLLPGRGQQRLDMWRASQKTEMTKQKVEEVRRLVLQWVIMDNQPFVQPTSPHFQAILLALNPAVGPALLSPRQLRRDLELAYGHVVQDAVAYLRKHGIRFSVSHDAWTSPSRRYTFLSFVYKLLDLWTGILVGDAASNNGRMCDALEYEFQDKKGTSISGNADALQDIVKHRRGDHSILCYNHALNRAMVTLYRALGVATKEQAKVLKAKDAEDDREVPVKGARGKGKGSEKEKEVEDAGSCSASDSDEEDRDGEAEDAEDEAGACAEGEGTANSPFRFTGSQNPDAPPSNDEEGDPELEQAEAIFADMRCQLPTVAEEDEDQQEGDDTATTSNITKTNSNDGEEDGDIDLASPLNKIADVVKQIHSSSDARREFKKYMAMQYLGDPKGTQRINVVPPKFNATRWNSRYKQMKVATKIKDGLLLFANNSKRVKVKAIGLEEADFIMIESIKDISQHVYRDTMEFERNDSHACMVLRGFGELVHAINIEIKGADEAQGSVASKLADGLREMLDRVKLYQEAAASSRTLLLAAVLHPKYRLATFLADYSDKVGHVKDLLKAEVDRFAGRPSPSGATKYPSAKEPAKTIKKYQRDAPTAAPSVVVAAEQTEIDAYLADRHPFKDAVEGSMFPGDTVLGWWKEHERTPPASRSRSEKV